jgi:hypothetical protein
MLMLCWTPFEGKKKKKVRTQEFATNPVCERRVDLLVCSLPLHRHSYIGFILAFASSIHNKQQVRETLLRAHVWLLDSIWRLKCISSDLLSMGCLKINGQLSR